MRKDSMGTISFCDRPERFGYAVYCKIIWTMANMRNLVNKQQIYKDLYSINMQKKLLHRPF